MLLQITIPSSELWDEVNEKFINTKEQVLSLEHSLVSLSKWESKWCKPFLTNDVKTTEETIDYIRCMTLTQNVNPSIYNFLTDDNIRQVNRYIEAPMTATTIHENRSNSSSGEKVTAEIIYYWMITLNIPFECQKWHLNRLLTLIRVCNIKNKPHKKMGTRQLMSRNAALNASRKQRLHTSG